MKRTALRKYLAGVSFLALAVTLAGCGGSAVYADGTYEGRSSVYEILDEEEEEGGDGYGVVTVTVKDNVITDCAYLTYTTDGALKDEDYGKEGGEIANRDYYNKAQRAVRACQSYAEQLAETGDLNQIDAISGATISYDQFKEAVREALEQARE